MAFFKAQDELRASADPALDLERSMAALVSAKDFIKFQSGQRGGSVGGGFRRPIARREG